jgi:DNA primase
MPWYDGDTLWKVSIRRPTGTPLHLTVAGSSNAAYNADNLNLTPVVLVESVLDALAVAQEARDICTPIATGTTGARTPLWMQRIVLAPLVLISYDADEAGGEARRFWKSALPMSGQIWLPWAEDHAEMLRQGHDLLEWVSQGIGSAAHLLK